MHVVLICKSAACFACRSIERHAFSVGLAFRTIERYAF